MVYYPQKLTAKQIHALHDVCRKGGTLNGPPASAEIIRRSDYKTVATIPVIADGQVNMSVTDQGGGAQPDGGRQGNFTVVDIPGDFRVFEGIPSQQYLARVYYNIRYNDPENDDTPTLVAVEVGVGGLTSCYRVGALVTFTWRGKAALAMSSPLEPFKAGAKGDKKSDAIKAILKAAGEIPGRLSIPETRQLLSDDFMVTDRQEYWASAYFLAHSAHLMLFYRPNGICLAKRCDNAPVITMGTGQDGWIIDQPSQGVPSNSDFANWVMVSYGDDGQGNPLQVPVYAPDKNLLSGKVLNWNGQPYWKRADIDAGDTDKPTAIRAGKDELRKRLDSAITTQATCMPFPFLEQGDVVKFDTPNYKGRSTVNTWTLPLGPGQPMTLGWNDVLSYRPV